MPVRTPRSSHARATTRLAVAESPRPELVVDAPSPAPSAAAAAPSLPPAPLYGYRGLKVWQRGMDLATAVFAVTRPLTHENVVIRDEMRRTALAVPSNIAAGNSLYARAEYVHHLSDAHGNVARLECLLQVAERLGTLPTQDTAPLLSLAADVGRMLRGLARALSAPPRETEVAEASE